YLILFAHYDLTSYILSLLPITLAAIPYPLVFSLIIYCYGPHRSLHSFPTRRSSDLFGADYVMAQISLRMITELFAMDLMNCVHSDRKSTRLNSSHVSISYAVFCLKKKSDAIYVLD